MSTYYWDLYVLYIKNCERENYINGIDPHHYRMEFNHFWPQCIFGDWPVGQYLTLKQHAIASALQTLVFKENCMCPWHKSYLPPALLELTWPLFCEAASVNALKTHEEKDEDGKSLHGLRLAATIHAEKDENGKSLHSLKIHSERDENGKSVRGKQTAARLHAEKDENGKSVVAMKTNSQVWQSTVDGFISTASSVAQHNRAKGWPMDARVRLS